MLYHVRVTAWEVSRGRLFRNNNKHDNIRKQRTIYIRLFIIIYESIYTYEL